MYQFKKGDKVEWQGIIVELFTDPVPRKDPWGGAVDGDYTAYGKIVEITDDAQPHTQVLYRVGYVSNWHLSFFKLVEENSDDDCSCNLTLLMNRGCQCGAFKREI
jgi:hypothetical protein